MREIDKIIIHCSDSPLGRDDSAADIDRWHKAKGWRKIGYHFVIRLDGTIETGREIDEVGAHCKGQNTHSIGICYIGGRGADGKPADTRTEKQRSALRSLVEYLRERYGYLEVYGHRYFDNSKACPCFNAQVEYE